MLESFSKRQKSKKHDKTGELLRKGLLLIERKEYKQATIEFSLAHEQDSKRTKEELEQEFANYQKKGNTEAVRAIGLVLLKTRENDCELINTLGNCARKLQDYKQANHFYRLALKKDNSYLKAFYNLSASMARVDKYDEEVKKALHQFKDLNSFVLPDYLNDLSLDPDQGFEATYTQLRLAIKENWKKRSIEEGQNTLQKDIYNLGLYALSQKKFALADENFNKLKNQQCNLEYLDMLIALSQTHGSNLLPEAIQKLMVLLKEHPNDRYLNVNIGLLYRQVGNRLLSSKFFLICSSLLEQSEGYFSMAALAKVAKENYDRGSYDKALLLYQKVVAELDERSSWEHLGELYLLKENATEATKAFRAVLKLDPQSSLAQNKLKSIFRYYLEKADESRRENKLQQALYLMERALDIERPPELLEETAKLYKKLKNLEKANALMTESYETRNKLRLMAVENEREKYLTIGKKHIKQKEFTAAIENLEKAARMRLDKDVFMYLAHIYKGLNMTRALQSLLNRWHKGQSTKMDTSDSEDAQSLRQHRWESHKRRPPPTTHRPDGSFHQRRLWRLPTGA